MLPETASILHPFGAKRSNIQKWRGRGEGGKERRKQEPRDRYFSAVKASPIGSPTRRSARPPAPPATKKGLFSLEGSQPAEQFPLVEQAYYI